MCARVTWTRGRCVGPVCGRADWAASEAPGPGSVLPSCTVSGCPRTDPAGPTGCCACGGTASPAQHRDTAVADLKRHYSDVVFRGFSVSFISFCFVVASLIPVHVWGCLSCAKTWLNNIVAKTKWIECSIYSAAHSRVQQRLSFYTHTQTQINIQLHPELLEEHVHGGGLRQERSSAAVLFQTGQGHPVERRVGRTGRGVRVRVRILMDSMWRE